MRSIGPASRRRLATVIAIVVCLSPGARAQSLTVTTFAGQTGGAVDGPGVTALLKSPMDVTVHDGNIYVADYANHTIRRISPTGMVTTFAGLGETIGSANGTGAAARFNNPVSLAADASGNIYVADMVTPFERSPPRSRHHAGRIRRRSGSTDGNGSAARFD